MAARMFNARASMGLGDVPFVGIPAVVRRHRRSGRQEIELGEGLCGGYRSCSFDRRRAAAAIEELVSRMKGKVELNDSLLWWVAGGFDAITLVAKAVEVTGSPDSASIIKYWNTLNPYPGYFGDYTFTPEQHNGYPTKDIVMSEAGSAKGGACDRTGVCLIAPAAVRLR